MRLLLWLTVFFTVCLMLTGPRQLLLGLMLLVAVFGVRSLTHTNRSRRILATLTERYGFVVTAGGANYRLNAHQTIQALKPIGFQAADGAVIVEAELNKHPHSFVAACGMHRLVLCRRLKGTGLMVDSQRRLGGCCDLDRSAVYLDLATPFLTLMSDAGEASVSRNLHHEIFHLVDYKMGLLQDEAWAKLNPPGFTYAYDTKRIKDKPLPGFITGYATAAIREDKAELFSYMMTDYPRVKRRISRDSVLAAKVTYLKAMLSQCCPEMDDAFWQRYT